jgi:NAD(P)-dependent dehydrogenase (short-subunit alcohol dehydrogenase family)
MQIANTKKVAFITGASRGIGAASALRLARAGYDVAITARTLKAGESQRYGNHLGEAVLSLPGSLEEVAAAIRATGQRALCFKADLEKPESLYQALADTIAQWGRVDVLYNQAAYQGAGNLALLADLEEEQLQRIFHADTVVPFRLIQQVLPVMEAQNSGVIVNMITSSAVMDPPKPANAGGWGWAYAGCKAALLRMAGVLKTEYAHTPLRFHNIEPGFVITEVMRATMDEQQLPVEHATSPETLAEVLHWICEHPEASNWQGKLIRAPRFAAEHGLIRP